MKKIKKSLSTKDGFEWVIAILILFIGIVALWGISWIATCGLIKLITLCFGWTFKWSYATGIWLVLCLLGSVFGKKGDR